MNTFKNTLFLGKVLFELGNVPSTNEYAQDLLKNVNVQDGTVIFTFNQTAGKGHFGSKWNSEASKNLAFTIIFLPHFLQARDQFYFNIAISLAVYDIINLYLKDKVSIKWPNDIYFRNYKMAGILIENSITGNQLSSGIAGIGLNINQIDFPPYLPNPISLKAITGKDYDLYEIVEQLGQQLEKRYLQLRAGQLEQLNEAYQKRLYRKGVEAKFQSGEKIFTGIIEGTTKEGKLIIREQNDQINYYGFKEVAFLM